MCTTHEMTSEQIHLYSIWEIEQNEIMPIVFLPLLSEAWAD